jgi:hypothetical protein
MKSRSLFCPVLTGLLVAVAALPVQAQGGRGGRAGGMGMGGNMQQGPMALLNIPEVVRELQISGETRTKLSELVEDVMAEIRETTQSMMEEMRGGGNRQEMMEKIRKEMESINDEAMSEVRALLDEKQLKRLRELHLQRMSWAALDEADVKQELRLTDDQLDEIKSLRDQVNSERREMMQGMGRGGRGGGGGGGNREEMAEAQNKIQQMEEDGFKKILSSEQFQQFTAMQGAKFEFPRPGRGAGGRGGRGGGAQNRDDF